MLAVPRLKRLYLLLLACAAVALCFRLRLAFRTEPDFDIMAHRKTYTNPVYDKWSKAKTDPGSDYCRVYFKDLLSLLPKLKDQKQQQHFDFDPLLYKKSKWMRDAQRDLRKALGKEHKRPTEEQVAALSHHFAARARVLAQFEHGFAADVGHVRAFGRCFVDGDATLDKNDVACRRSMELLFPWASGKPPRKTSWDNRVVELPLGSRCFARTLAERNSGRGIVIPILPSYTAARLADVARLLHVLRVLHNTLPVEIVYFGEELLRDSRAALIQAARGAADVFPVSLRNHLQNHGLDRDQFKYPAQNVFFVDLSPAVAVEPSDAFVLAAAALFNTFEEFVALSSDTIPFEVASLFENEDYQRHGMLLFKKRALMEDRPVKFPPGFFEVNELVNAVLQPDAHLKEVLFTHTRRVRDAGFVALMDPSLFVLNKTRTMPGLLMACLLPQYRFLAPKYAFGSDHLWLGQELVGSYVHFNRHFAAAPGVVTPSAAHTLSKEVCSSSWAQILDRDDRTLVYVTAHQLQHRLSTTFRRALEARLSNGNQRALAEQTVKRNPLFIKSVLRPIALDEPQGSDDGEHTVPWVLHDDFGGVDDYWCCYDIVGSVLLRNRGVIVDFDERAVSLFTLVLDVWVSPPRGKAVVG